MRKVLYTGSFDPITKGHMNIIEQALNLFDEVIVAVLQNNSKKSSLFTLEERLEIIKEIYKDYKNVTVITGRGAAVDIALNSKCQAIVRGIRNSNDCDYEFQMATINKEISENKINTVCLFADSKYQFVSSSMVKELFKLNKDISNYVSPLVKSKIITKGGN